jgi:hypothetical protein
MCYTGTGELALPRSTPIFGLLARLCHFAAFDIIGVDGSCYLQGVSTRRVGAVVQQRVIEGISKSQVSELAQHLDTQVESFRNRRLDAEA